MWPARSARRPLRYRSLPEGPCAGRAAARASQAMATRIRTYIMTRRQLPACKRFTVRICCYEKRIRGAPAIDHEEPDGSDPAARDLRRHVPSVLGGARSEERPVGKK